MDLLQVARFRTWYILAGPDECWLWFGSKDPDGYGNFKIDGKQTRANRISYLIHKGDFDPALYVLHTCDNPPCVNPNHLFLGTKQDNTEDMKSKGRHAGRPTPACKGEIMKILPTTVMGDSAIAEWFGVSPGFVKKCRAELYEK